MFVTTLSKQVATVVKTKFETRVSVSCTAFFPTKVKFLKLFVSFVVLPESSRVEKRILNSLHDMYGTQKCVAKRGKNPKGKTENWETRDRKNEV